MKILKQDGWTLLHHAASWNNCVALRALIHKGASLDQTIGKGWTPLMLALWNRHKQIAIELINAGADPLIENKYVCSVMMQFVFFTQITFIQGESSLKIAFERLESEAQELEVCK